MGISVAAKDEVVADGKVYSVTQGEGTPIAESTEESFDRDMEKLQEVLSKAAAILKESGLEVSEIDNVKIKDNETGQEREVDDLHMTNATGEQLRDAIEQAGGEVRLEEAQEAQVPSGGSAGQAASR